MRCESAEFRERRNTVGLKSQLMRVEDIDLAHRFGRPRSVGFQTNNVSPERPAKTCGAAAPARRAVWTEKIEIVALWNRNNFPSLRKHPEIHDVILGRIHASFQ